MKSSAASSWFLRAARGFRRQLLREMLSAQKAGQALREVQLKQFQESKWNGERTAASYTEPRHHIPNAFRCISLTDSTALYTKCNSSGRPHQVWSHEARHPHNDTLLFEEEDPSCTVDVTLTRDREYITINSNTRTSSEVHILTPHYPTEPPLLLRPRQHLVEYYVDHAHGQFYIFSNLAADQEFKVMTAENLTPHKWRDYYKPKNGFRLQDMELFDWCTVLYGMKDNVPVVMVISADQHDEEPVLLYREDVCHIEKSGTHEFHSKTLTFWASSPAKPPTLYVCSGKKMTTYNSKDQLPFSDYCTERVAAVSGDGTHVPMTLCYHRGLLRKDGNNPVLVCVYGCYGENLYMGYQPDKLPLVSRGWVLAYCHVRGGGELGRRWYYHGQGREKHNTFEDLRACVDYLHTEAYSQPRLTALYGRSAGGMAVGMFCNLWPHLAQAAILQVPFVNVIDTLSDPSLYLTAKDYHEFGSPHASEADLQHILSICPYSSLRPQDYPAMLVLASKRDNIIPFEGVQKYVSKLKLCVEQHWSNTSQKLSMKQTWMSLLSTKTWTGMFTESPIPRGTVLFHIDKHHNHHGSGENRHTLKEVALMFSFIHQTLGLKTKQE